MGTGSSSYVLDGAADFALMEATINRLEAENAWLVKERDNLQAALTARSKTLLKARNLFIDIHNNLEDDGDRIYFGSTNDADNFKDAVHELDDWAWEDIVHESELKDIYEISRKAHADLRTAEARAVAAEAKLAALAPVNMAAKYNPDEPTTHEIQLLREIAGELPASPWGAWVGECLEWLKGHGYLTRQQKLTEKATAFLASLKDQTPEGGV